MFQLEFINKNFMHYLYNFIICAACCFSLLACGETSGRQASSSEPDYERIISLSGAVTETLFVLGHGDKIVGVDVTSTYPASVAQLPKLGHVTQLNAEGILGLNPDLIIAEATERENRTLKQLAQSGVDILFVPKPNSLEAPLGMARAIVDKLGDPSARLDALNQKIETDRRELQSLTSQWTDRPKVLFIYARGKGNLMVAGVDTPAEAMIEAAGGRNAVTAFEGFKALSAEGVIKAQPEVILMFESGLRSLDGEGALLAIPGIEQTPAGRRRRIIAMDGHYLLGFGPRASAAALDLARQLRDNETL